MTTKVHNRMIDGTEANVMDFGAVGDGVNNDTLAFEAALAASDVIFIPADKTFLVGDVPVEGKTVIGYGTIKKLSTAESAFHLLGESPKIQGLTFSAQVSSGQPNTDIKLGEGARDCVIFGNTFMSPTYSAIAAAVDTAQGGVPYTNKVVGVLITNNTFKAGDVGTYARPIYLHSVNNSTISNNIIRDCNFDAIRLRENDGYCIVNSNEFINIGDPSWVDSQTRDAIDTFWSGTTLTISNNIVRTTAFAGFDIKGVTPDNPGKKTRRVIITGNQIENTRFNAIFIRGGIDYDGLGNNEYIDSILISNNIIEDCSQEPGFNAIQLDGQAKWLNIHDNIILGTQGRGINLKSDQTSEIVKGVKISGNILINNGQASKQTSAEGAINVQGIDDIVITNNICENDTDGGNPYQACGIFYQSVSGIFSPSQSAIISENICKNNTIAQIIVESNGNRNNGIAVFRDNLQIGTGAVNRGTWQDQRGEYWGNDIPAPGDGIFRRGDIIKNVTPSEMGTSPNKYIVTGWQRISADGSSSVLNTDWVQLRTLTGN